MKKTTECSLFQHRTFTKMKCEEENLAHEDTAHCVWRYWYPKENKGQSWEFLWFHELFSCELCSHCTDCCVCGGCTRWPTTPGTGSSALGSSAWSEKRPSPSTAKRGTSGSGKCCPPLHLHTHCHDKIHCSFWQSVWHRMVGCAEVISGFQENYDWYEADKKETLR